MGNSKNNGGSDDGGEEVYNGNIEPVLVSLSNSYLNEDRFSVGDNRPSFCSVYTVY